MPVTIGEMDVQVAPATPPSPTAAAPAVPPPPDRDAIARLLQAEADRRARLHAD